MSVEQRSPSVQGDFSELSKRAGVEPVQLDHRRNRLLVLFKGIVFTRGEGQTRILTPIGSFLKRGLETYPPDF